MEKVNLNEEAELRNVHYLNGDIIEPLGDDNTDNTSTLDIASEQVTLVDETAPYYAFMRVKNSNNPAFTRFYGSKDKLYEVLSHFRIGVIKNGVLNKAAEGARLTLSDSRSEYYVRGLWLAPYGPNGVYSWPWDLGIPSGALKDVNNGWKYWGYVQNGQNKNITSGMKTSFPANASGAQRICISLWGKTPNYTDSSGNTFVDFGVYPITITFLDGRFDDYTWVGNTGAIYEWSADKRTITIYRVPASANTSHDSWVCRSDISDTSIEKVRADLTDVYVNVTGLSEHYGEDVPVDPSTLECWEAKANNTTIYHKDRTVENCWRKYGLMVQSTEDAYTVNTVKNTTAFTKIKMPIATDIAAWLTANNSTTKATRWNIKAENYDFWNDIKAWYASNPAPAHTKELFKDSNIAGEVTLQLSNSYAYLDDAFYGTNVTKVNLTYTDSGTLTSCNRLFRNAKELVSFTTTKSIVSADYSGAFEHCQKLTTIPANIGYTTKEREGQHVGNFGYTFEYCSALTTIPKPTSNHTIIPYIVTQMFNYCYALTTIGPILDFKYINPIAAYSNNVFNACASLTTMSLGGLNHGDWNLDGVTRNGVTHGDLSLLDADSILYLFDNLTDLTTHDSSIVISADTITASPRVASANLYCPITWFGGYVTDAMITAAKAKGWNIYNNGTLV